MNASCWIPKPPQEWPRSTQPHGPMSPQPDGVPLFGCVAKGAVYRSGQPTTEGFRWLSDQGFKTVLSLRAEGPGDAWVCPLNSGMTLLRLAWDDEREPPENGAIALLDMVSNADRWPLLVHCKAGRGRAGVAAGIIRASLDGWTFDQVMEEVRLYRVFLGLIRVPLARVQRHWLRAWCEDVSAD